jgi:hypothetical protein
VERRPVVLRIKTSARSRRFPLVVVPVAVLVVGGLALAACNSSTTQLSGRTVVKAATSCRRTDQDQTDPATPVALDTCLTANQGGQLGFTRPLDLPEHTEHCT